MGIKLSIEENRKWVTKLTEGNQRAKLRWNSGVRDQQGPERVLGLNVLTLLVGKVKLRESCLTNSSNIINVTTYLSS